MPTIDEAARIAAGLPGVTEGTRYRNRAWSVAGAAFAWERPLSKADIVRFGDDTPPTGPLLALSVADLNDKEAVLAANHAGLFTIVHFDGYPAVLVQLDVIEEQTLREAIVDAWLACAPAELARAFLERR